jgi:hypothetical protein
MIVVPGCGTEASTGGGNDAQRSIAVSQNEAAAAAAAKATQLLAQFDEFALRHLEIDTYDATTGQEWFDFYDDFFIPGIEELQTELGKMADEEAELQALVEASGASQQSLRSKIGMVALIYIGGALTFAAAVGTWAAFARRVVPKVDRVNRSVQAGRDQGLSQAEAMAAASDEYKDAQDEVFLDLQTTIATEAFLSGLSVGASRCGKIAIDLTNMAGEAIGVDPTQLLGKKKGASNDTQKGSFEDDEFFYLGQSEDGTYGNLPLGEYDFFVFKEGHVRGNAQGVLIETCSTTESVEVTMATLDEFFADDQPTDPDAPPTEFALEGRWDASMAVGMFQVSGPEIGQGNINCLTGGSGLASHVTFDAEEKVSGWDVTLPNCGSIAGSPQLLESGTVPDGDLVLLMSFLPEDPFKLRWELVGGMQRLPGRDFWSLNLATPSNGRVCPGPTNGKCVEGLVVFDEGPDERRYQIDSVTLTLARLAVN